MKIEKLRDQTDITLQHQSYHGTTRDLWMSVRHTELGPLINLVASGDMSPATTRRLAHALLVAADMGEQPPRREDS
ncbi:hypothetical protein LCGC14_0827890 [marine sediment metagenome]|uniref:Uncharacterized protein n=1 Tax=marine sediment metagenome TaxID=412755 RepID=A0A0F9PLI2_9ZZZZ